MRTHCFDLRVTALSSITHNGGESFGINQRFRREKLVQPDGTVEEVPVVSGNGMRGLLRDLGMLHMCRALGYGVDKDGKVEGLSLAAFYFLFSGGSLTNDGGKAVNEEEARRLRSLIPLASVFGGAIGNRILNGRAKIGKMIPVCTETAHVLPEVFASRAKASMFDVLNPGEMFTRKDDEKNERLRETIKPEARTLIEQARAAKLLKSNTEPAGETGQSQQMMYYVETLAAGTQFYWSVVLDDVTPVEYDAFLTTLVEFLKMPYIGGKSGTGHGKVKIECDSLLEISTTVEVSSEVGIRAGKLYADHLASRAPEMREFLTSMRGANAA